MDQLALVDLPGHLVEAPLEKSEVGTIPPPFGRTGCIPCGDPGQEQQYRRCERFLNMTLHMLASKAWASKQFSEEMPDMFAGIYHNNPEKARSRMAFIRSEWEMLVEAEGIAVNNEHPAKDAVASTLSIAAKHRCRLVYEWISIAQDTHKQKKTNTHKRNTTNQTTTKQKTKTHTHRTKKGCRMVLR